MSEARVQSEGQQPSNQWATPEPTELIAMGQLFCFWLFIHTNVHTILSSERDKELRANSARRDFILTLAEITAAANTKGSGK